jgi:hypothetical protein
MSASGESRFGKTTEHQEKSIQNPENLIGDISLKSSYIIVRLQQKSCLPAACHGD